MTKKKNIREEEVEEGEEKRNKRGKRRKENKQWSWKRKTGLDEEEVEKEGKK